VRFAPAFWAGWSVLWIVLFILTEDPQLRLGFALVAALGLLTSVLFWWDRRKRNARGPEVSKHPERSDFQ
jgi:hypothetical protein